MRWCVRRAEMRATARSGRAHADPARARLADARGRAGGRASHPRLAHRRRGPAHLRKLLRAYRARAARGARRRWRVYAVCEAAVLGARAPVPLHRTALLMPRARATGATNSQLGRRRHQARVVEGQRICRPEPRRKRLSPRVSDVACVVCRRGVPCPLPARYPMTLTCIARQAHAAEEGARGGGGAAAHGHGHHGLRPERAGQCVGAGQRAGRRRGAAVAQRVQLRAAVAALLAAAARPAGSQRSPRRARGARGGAAAGAAAQGCARRIRPRITVHSATVLTAPRARLQIRRTWCAGSRCIWCSSACTAWFAATRWSWGAMRTRAGRSSTSSSSPARWPSTRACTAWSC